MATPPTFSSGAILTAAQMNAVGLWLVKSQTIGAGVTSVVVANAFSADYDNYLITVSGGTTSANGGIGLQLNNSTGSTYLLAGTYGNYGVNAGLGFYPAATVRWTDALVGGGSSYSGSIFLSSPFASRATTGWTDATSQSSFYKFSLVDTSTNSSTGFTFTPISGTFTGGTIRVYGYRN